jgi:hypothetical protein
VPEALRVSVNRKQYICQLKSLLFTAPIGSARKDISEPIRNVPPAVMTFSDDKASVLSE